MKIRTAIEKLSRNRTLIRRLPERFGNHPLVVSPDSRLQLLKPGEEGLDLLLLNIAEECISSQDVVWDVGANVGVFSLAAAARGASALAIEADPWLAELVRRTTQLTYNKALKVDVVSTAVSDTNGVARLMISRRGRASNALEVTGGRGQMGGVRHMVSVPTLTLDTLLQNFAPPTFMKIDIEGAEALALRGACVLLKEHRPRILIETGSETADEVTEILRSSGYDLYDASLSLSKRLPIEKCVENTIAFPT